MKTFIAASTAVTLLLAQANALAQITQIKPGTWEMTHKSASLPRPVVEKTCVTRADLAELTKPSDDDEPCKYVKPPAISGKTWSADKACPDGRKVHAEVTADSPERVKGLITSTAPKAGGAPMSVEMSGRWLSAGCSKNE